jgi:hypothetical protein
MTIGAKREHRPGDVIGNPVQVMRIATGEIDNAPVVTRERPPPLAPPHKVEGETRIKEA